MKRTDICKYSFQTTHSGNMQEELKRLFFGIEIQAPWPHHLPKGRLLDEKHRHLTLAFLGNISYPPLREILNDFPKVSFKIGSVGYFDSCLTLPPHHPNVIAWHVHWLEEHTPIIDFQKILSDWLICHGYSLEKRPWMPHMTLCRKPFDAHRWLKNFFPLPFYTGGIHLYESIGNLHYVPIWSFPIKAPFDEINHTADVAFVVRGENLQQLYCNAFTALTFKSPEFIEFFKKPESLQSLDDIIIALNELISRADRSIGSSMKAVSFHGEIISAADSLLQWEMIVDV